MENDPHPIKALGQQGNALSTKAVHLLCHNSTAPHRNQVLVPKGNKSEQKEMPVECELKKRTLTISGMAVQERLLFVLSD